ncbi:hypothetical protein OsJ_14055 [Oryza sativa Japonica Group]|nr:hypothetical protein OsJ_14055 [Oryza sativa Japonica Group]
MVLNNGDFNARFVRPDNLDNRRNCPFRRKDENNALEVQIEQIQHHQQADVHEEMQHDSASISDFSMHETASVNNMGHEIQLIQNNLQIITYQALVPCFPFKSLPSEVCTSVAENVFLPLIISWNSPLLKQPIEYHWWLGFKPCLHVQIPRRVWYMAFGSSKDQVVFVRPAKRRRVDAEQTEVVKRPRAKLLHGTDNLTMSPSCSAQGEKSDLNQESPKKRSGVQPEPPTAHYDAMKNSIQPASPNSVENVHVNVSDVLPEDVSKVIVLDSDNE